MSNNSLVKAVIDTGKPDTIEFQLLPGHSIQEGDILTYDKMNGLNFHVETISSNGWVTCTIQGFDIYKLSLKYFMPMTVLFVMNRDAEVIYTDLPDDGITGRVSFP